MEAGSAQESPRRLVWISWLMVLTLGLAAPGWAEEWLRLEVAATGQGFWVDLQARRYGALGTCDGGRSLEDLQRSGQQVNLQMRELMQGDLAAGPMSVEQALSVRVEGNRGTLRARAASSGELVEVALRVTWTRGRTAPGCGP